MPERYDDKGNLIKERYDDSGNLVGAQQGTDWKTLAHRFFLGETPADIEARKQREISSGVPPKYAGMPYKGNDPQQERSIIPELSPATSLPGKVGKFAYDVLVRPLGTVSGMMGAVVPEKLPSIEEEKNLGQAVSKSIGGKYEMPPVSKQLPPATSTQLPAEAGPVSSATGAPKELLHPNRIEPASEILDNVPKPVETAAKSEVPEIQAAAQDIQKKGIIQRIKERQDPFTMSIEEQLNRQGPAGQVINEKVTRASLKERMFKSQWKSLSPTVDSLSPQEFENAVDVIEGNAKPINDKVSQAAKEMSYVMNNAGKGLSDSGITIQNLKGEQVPFSLRDNYFPHHYPEGFWDRPELIDEIIAQGKGKISRDEALDIVQNRRKYGELLSSFQRQRIPADLPGYLKTPEVYEQYLNTAARRLAMAQELGPEDIVGKPLSSLIEQTRNPDYVTKLLRRIIPGRDELLSATEEAIQPINNLATKLTAYAHLSRYAISRIAPSTEMIIRGNARNYLSEMAKVLTDSGYANDIKAGTGVTENISNAMLDAANKYPKSWLFSKPVDEFMRTVSGGMGRGLAQDLFEKLKANPNDLNSIKRLQNLIMEDPTKVLKQNNLTKDQINMAGARFAELTQGLPEARKVPMAFSEPLLQIPLIMKKYAFQHGAMLKNAIMQSPNKPKAIALAAGLTQLFGEGIGDVKAALKGTGTSLVGGESPSEKIASRGKFESYLMQRAGMGEHPALGRILDNEANAWIPFEIELLQSIGDKDGLLKAFGGPAIGDASELIGGGISGIPKYIGARIPVIGSR